MNAKDYIRDMSWVAITVPVIIAGYILVRYLRNVLGRREFERRADELAESLSKNKQNIDKEAVKSEIRKQAYLTSAMTTQPGLFGWLYNMSLNKLAKLLGQ